MGNNFILLAITQYQCVQFYVSFKWKVVAFVVEMRDVKLLTLARYPQLVAGMVRELTH
jgi:hypothetical protein